ncbi:MAG TPA: hypothetical protein VFH79_09315 [Candidatus Limnocylindria bacterium]|jgi:hypothetical protein|nr:hypothetical protein [Candidatus Limnocylindria bacterium]
MNWGQFVVQWLHVGLGVLWFGTVLYNATILIPAISRLPLGEQRRVGSLIGEQGFKVIRPVAGAVILLGLIRGTLFGPIKSLDMLTSAYGITWLVGLAFAIGAYVWAERMVGPALARMNAIPEAEALGPDGAPTPALESAVGVVKRNAVLELGFFAVIFTCMILMRFGL